MAEVEKKTNDKAKDSLRNQQIDEAKEMVPIKTITQNSLQGDKGTKVLEIIDNFERENDEMKKNDEEIAQNTISVGHNSFQTRLKVLAMEMNVVKTYFDKQINEIDDDSSKKLHNLQTHMNIVYADINNIKKIEKDLRIAENLSYELVKKIKEVFKKNAVNKEQGKKPEDDIEVPDYRSIVTVRGTKEDVTNCILKAQAALENGKYDRAEKLLLKAERIMPTKNARDLLNQVQTAHLKLYPEPAKTATKSVEQFKEEKLKAEYDSISAAKCLTVYEKAFTTGNLEKAERMLKKAKRFDSSLNVAGKLSLIKAAKTNAIKEEKQIQEIERAKTGTNADECRYKSMKDIVSNSSTETNPNNELTSSGTQFSQSDDENQTGMDMQIEKQEKQAKPALENSKYVQDETKDLVNEHRVVKEPKQRHERIENATDAVEQAKYTIVNEEVLKSEDDSINAVKCQTAFEKEFTTSNLKKHTDNKFAAYYLDMAKKAYEAGYVIEFKRNLNGARKYDADLTVKTEAKIKECFALKMHEKNTCMDLALEAYIVRQLDKAELYLLQAIQIYPNDDAQNKLQYIQDIRAESDDVAETSFRIQTP